MSIRLVADIQNRLFWRACTGGGSECCIPSTGWNQASRRRATIVMAQAEPTILQTRPRNAVTSANAAAALGLRTYLTHDESRHHRVSALSHPSTYAPPVLHQPELGGQEVSVATGFATPSAWESVPSRPVTWPDLRRGVSAGDRERPLVTEVNGPANCGPACADGGALLLARSPR